jgi:hypothetical protein
MVTHQLIKKGNKTMQEIKKDPLYLFIKDRESVIRNKLPPLYFSDEDDNPASFLNLSPQEKTTLVAWVLNTLVKGKSINTEITSYGIKHLFDKSLNGFYIKNGVMKGAMLIAGFKVNDLPYVCEFLDQYRIYTSSLSPPFIGSSQPLIPNKAIIH